MTIASLSDKYSTALVSLDRQQNSGEKDLTPLVTTKTLELLGDLVDQSVENVMMHEDGYSVGAGIYFKVQRKTPWR